LGATSGDTGSAAIYGLKDVPNCRVVILHPRGRVSDVQRKQMTTVKGNNIINLAVAGTFDDCQDIVKASFANKDFRERVKLGAVNSINWCRVLAQTTYYYWSYLRVTDENKDITHVNYSVPTGNFGDILAGYYAKRMGLPVGKLIVATNENDILHRFFSKGEYHRYDIAETISPSMDICVSSNFERYLYHLAGDDSTVLTSWMEAFESTGKITLTGKKLEVARRDFLSARADTALTLQTIKEYYEKYNYMLCPHSAVGVSAIHQLGEVNKATVCLATAHDAKFPEACKRAVNPLPSPPSQLAKLFSMKTRSSRCPNDASVVQAFVEKRIEERIASENAAEKRNSQMKKAVLSASVVAGLAIFAFQLTKKR
jgi:threonine synthase